MNKKRKIFRGLSICKNMTANSPAWTGCTALPSGTKHPILLLALKKKPTKNLSETRQTAPTADCSRAVVQPYWSTLTAYFPPVQSVQCSRLFQRKKKKKNHNSKT